MKNLILLYNLLFVFLSTIFAQTITYTIESTFSDNNVYVSSCDLLMQIESTFSDDNVYVYNPNNANSTEINDLIEDLRDATFSWYGYFEANSAATYNNNVNSLNFKKASGVDTAYLDISGSEGYDGRYPLDDFWGEPHLDDMISEVAKIFPERELVKLNTDHELFHIFFDIDRVAQVPGRMVTWDYGGFLRMDDPSYPPEVYAILDDDNRIMMVANYNTDLGDGWEHTFYEGYPTQSTNDAYKIGINFLIYAFSH